MEKWKFDESIDALPKLNQIRIVPLSWLFGLRLETLQVSIAVGGRVLYASLPTLPLSTVGLANIHGSYYLFDPLEDDAEYLYRFYECTTPPKPKST